MQSTNTASDRRTPLFDPFLEVTSDIEALNVLLRGELSAAENYAAAIDKCEGQPFVLELKQIRAEHREAANLLCGRIRAHGGDQSISSGLWGGVAALITNTAKVFGLTPLLAVLRRGEEHGISEYQKILNNAALSRECVALIECDLLPRCRCHVATLHRLSESIT
jgi:Domain of unknown function (DUF2383)